MSENMRRLLDLRVEQGAVHLTLDEGETFELAPGSVPQGLPDIGGSISSPLLAEIRLAAERKKVARRIFSLLDKRLMPLAKIRRKLADEEYSEPAVEAVLEQMHSQGLYSDHTYAAAYCRECLSTRLVGRRYLEQKLRGKLIPAQIAAEVVAENLDLETEVELAHRAAEWKWKRARGTLDRKAEEKVARYLMGRGFGAGLAWKAVRANKPDPEVEKFEEQEF